MRRTRDTDGFDPAQYGSDWADFYDQFTEWAGVEAESASAVAFLAALAGDGAVLELGSGTGRIASPLSAVAHRVDCIEISTAMIELAQQRPRGGAVELVASDIRSFDLPTRYDLIYCVFATLFSLPSQADQIDCLSTAARHLAPGGHLVIETIVPQPGRFRGGQLVDVRHIQHDQIMLVTAKNDLVHQVVNAQFIVCSSAGMKMHPIRLRWAWPSELDLMARIAGLELVERWAGWERQPFTDTAQTHVSVYTRTQSV